MSEKELTKKETKPKANIKFVNEDINPPSVIRDGRNERIELPEESAQRAGFYHREADRIVVLFPSLYKRLKAKDGR